MLKILSQLGMDLVKAKGQKSYLNAFSSFEKKLQEIEKLDIDGIDVDNYKDQTIEILETTITNGYKAPNLSMAEIRYFETILNAIKAKQETDEIKKQIERVLEYQKEATAEKTAKAIKAILFNSNKKKVASNIINILRWIEQLKNYGKIEDNNKMLLYMSNSPDGNKKGGNGKSYIIDALRTALEEVKIPSKALNAPTRYTNEITDDFSKYLVCIAEEQSFNIPSDTHKIIDHSNYDTKVKYERSQSLKSIANFIGTTNESLVGKQQTLTRRIAAVYCNENLYIPTFTDEQKKYLPSRAEQISAWQYLLTHDVSRYINQISENEEKDALSNAEREILWVLADWKTDMANMGSSLTAIELRTFKEAADRANKKIYMSSAIEVAKKYGATVVKKGSHGRESDGNAIINIETMNIPLELFDEGDIFTIPEVYEKINKYFKITPPTPDGNKPEEEPKEPTVNTPVETPVNTVKETTTEDLTDEWEYMLDCLENSEKEEEIVNEEPVNTEPVFDTIPESNTTYRDQYQAAPTNRPEDQFELLNQCLGGRKQEDIICRRNFIFEVDHIPEMDNIECLKWQIKKMKQLSNEGIINRAVFSGSKSIHCRITVNRLIETNEEYKYIWKQLNDTYFDGYADEACSNPNRLTRNPNGVRINKDGTKGKIQKLLYSSNNVIDIADIKIKWNNYYRNVVEVNNIKKAMMAEHSPKRYETIEETVSHWKDGKGKEAVMACIDGTASYQEAINAISSLRIYNYTWEELSRELSWVTNWDKKWRLHSFYDSLK